MKARERPSAEITRAQHDAFRFRLVSQRLLVEPVHGLVLGGQCPLARNFRLRGTVADVGALSLIHI